MEEGTAADGVVLLVTKLFEFQPRDIQAKVEKEGKVPTQLPRERRTPSLHLPERKRKRDKLTVWQAVDDDQDPNQERASDPILDCN